jgi:acylphosphatase
MNAAVELGLTGWVRNRRDGSVEVLAEGDLAKIRSLVGALERGSPSSAVREVNTRLQPATGEFGSFYVRHTL